MVFFKLSTEYQLSQPNALNLGVRIEVATKTAGKSPTTRENMSYRVVCIREFAGLNSKGSFINIPMPKKDAIYTCINERFDGMGMHSLILAELAFRGGYNSEYFAPVDDIGPRSNRVEKPEEVLI